MEYDNKQNFNNLNNPTYKDDFNGECCYQKWS